MKKDEVEKNPDKPIFPAPPLRPTDVQFRLRRFIWLKAHWFTATGDDTVTALGGLEAAYSAEASGQPVNVEVKEKCWIPSESNKNMGTWMQETTFRSAFQFTCPPSFETDIMRVKVSYALHLRFPRVFMALYSMPWN